MSILADIAILPIRFMSSNPNYPSRSAECSSDGKRARGGEKESFPICLFVCLAGGDAAACTKTHSLSRPKISSIAVWGTDLDGVPIAGCGRGWMQRRVRRRIERLLRRATQKRNSDGESISGMSGTDFHAIFSTERPSAFWPRLTRTNTHWRTWIFFRSPYPASARGIDQPGGRLHTFLSYRRLTAMVVGSTGPPHHLTLK